MFHKLHRLFSPRLWSENGLLTQAGSQTFWDRSTLYALRGAFMAVQFEAGGKTVTVGGMSKGSGMIHPNMCTMLGFVTTDIAISKELLQEALREDVVDTFNMISVDGDTSTNDTLVVLANGCAENPEITEKNEDYENFVKALHEVNETLAKMMAGDGEGATALFETRVIHAATKEDARTLAKSVICSSLTKAAIFGHDANWGRILCALGYSGAKFDPEAVELYFDQTASLHVLRLRVPVLFPFLCLDIDCGYGSIPYNHNPLPIR